MTLKEIFYTKICVKQSCQNSYCLTASCALKLKKNFFCFKLKFHARVVKTICFNNYAVEITSF